MIKVGDALPAVTLTEYVEVEGNGCSIGPNPVKLPEALAGKTVVLFTGEPPYAPPGQAVKAGQQAVPARGQLVRVTQEYWMAPWSYYLTAPAAHFRRPVVRTLRSPASGESGRPNTAALFSQ